MTEPTSLHELASRQLRHTRVSGEGIHGVTQHFPCPFCGAAEWFVVKIIDFAQDHGPIECAECGRSASMLYRSTGGGPMAGGTSEVEVVQTGGPDQPDWLEPKMRDCRAHR